jgi:hypothetical protein
MIIFYNIDSGLRSLKLFTLVRQYELECASRAGHFQPNLISETGALAYVACLSVTQNFFTKLTNSVKAFKLFIHHCPVVN